VALENNVESNCGEGEGGNENAGGQRLTSSVSGYFKIAICCLFILVFTASVCLAVLIYQERKNKTGFVQKGGQVAHDNTPMPLPKPIPLSQPPTTSQPACICKAGFTNSNADTCTCVPCEVCLSERGESERDVDVPERSQACSCACTDKHKFPDTL